MYTKPDYHLRTCVTRVPSSSTFPIHDILSTATHHTLSPSSFSPVAFIFPQVGINPGLFAAYKGHHYAGPGNHFWKCLYMSGLIPEQMVAEDDFKLLPMGIGFTNMVERSTKGSADLTRKEIKDGAKVLLEKLQKFQPKVVVFNGKLIYEVFSGKKEFNFGWQKTLVEGTKTVS